MEENTKYQAWIGKDGTLQQKLMLSLEDKIRREELIAKHFLAFYENTYGVRLPKKITQRDNPHDFTFSDETGDIFLEIVAISDSSSGFRKQSNQKLLERLVGDLENSIIAIVPPEATNKELREAVNKINEYPAIEDAKDHILELFQERINAQKPIVRRLADKNKKRIYITDGINEPIKKIVNDAIKRKEGKGYDNVPEMILLIDNQIIEYSIKNIGTAWINLVKQNQTSLFREIFLYTGYYSKNDSTHSEFNIFPIKCALDKKVKMAINPFTRWTIPIIAFVNFHIYKSKRFLRQMLNKI
ncbi:MAG: hypothetical protein Q8P25_03670 [Candidatus Curtissbacteria bacterium]|nr:hypothetical protein [Candidatus Curtissbacteria bacterium]